MLHYEPRIPALAQTEPSNKKFREPLGADERFEERHILYFIGLYRRCQIIRRQRLRHSIMSSLCVINRSFSKVKSVSCRSLIGCP